MSVEAKRIPSITLGPTSSLLWSIGLASVLLLVARPKAEGPPGSAVKGGPACRTVLGWRGHSIFSVVWSPDGLRLAASGWGPEIRLWELETGVSRSLEPGDGRPHFVLGWSADGRGVSVGDLEGRVESWDTAEGPPPFGSRPAASADDGPSLAGATRGALIRLWEPVDGRFRLVPPAGRLANAIAYTVDGRGMASAGRDGVVRIWEPGSGRLLREIPVGEGGLSHVSFSPDGTRLTTGSGGPARVWDLATGRELARLGGPEGGFSSLAFSPDGRRLAGASWSGKVHVWDLESKRELACLIGHERHILTLAWSPDGTRLASAGHDATVRIWDLDPSR